MQVGLCLNRSLFSYILISLQAQMQERASHLVPGIGVNADGREMQRGHSARVLILDVACICGNCVHILEGKVIVRRAGQQQEPSIQQRSAIETQLWRLLEDKDREVPPLCL